MQTGIARMVPFWSKLSKARQEVLTEFIADCGMIDFLSFARLHAAIVKNNIEHVCSILGREEWVEKYRKG